MFPIASKLLFQGIVVVAIDFTERYDEGVYVNVTYQTHHRQRFMIVREKVEKVMNSREQNPKNVVAGTRCAVSSRKITRRYR
jgi:hypothetical protein